MIINLGRERESFDFSGGQDHRSKSSEHVKLF